MMLFFHSLYLFLQKRFGYYLSFTPRPITTNQVKLQADQLKKIAKIAIVMQGPLIKEDNFTLETIKLYRQLFPQFQIILSTWHGENSSLLKAIVNQSVIVLLNRKPRFAGIANINFQLISSLKGLKRAQKLNYTYVLKTRTDQRIYNPNTFEFLNNILAVFPLSKATRQKTTQKERLVGVSLNSFKYRLYSLSDMNIYGNIDDVLRYFQAPLDLRKKHPVFKNIGEFSKFRLTETYLSTSFLQKIGYTLRWTLADSWQVFKEHFCVVDQQSLDLYWPKYAFYQERRYQSYGGVKNNQELSFLEWFNLYSGLNNKNKIPEQVLLKGFEELISWEK